jgi:hypothetical protein
VDNSIKAGQRIGKDGLKWAATLEEWMDVERRKER